MSRPATDPTSPPDKASLVERIGRDPRFIFWSVALISLGLVTMWVAIVISAAWKDTKGHEAVAAIAVIINLLFLAVAGIYGHWQFTRFRRHQEELQSEKSKLQHEMAMNIEMTVESVPHGNGRFVRPIVPVHNVSTNKFGIPQVCFTVLSVPLNGLKTHRSWDDDLDKLYERPLTRNINAYSNMPGVKPQERESFTGWLYFDEEDIRTHPTVVIQVDVVGVKEQGTFATKEARAEFMVWMKENGGGDEMVFKNWSADEVREIKEAINSCQLWHGVDPKKLTLNRCLVSKPAGAKQFGRDYVHSAKWGDVLDESVAWDRYAIVSLVDGRVLAVGKKGDLNGAVLAAAECRAAS